jgi:hypothetical protein
MDKMDSDASPNRISRTNPSLPHLERAKSCGELIFALFRSQPCQEYRHQIPTHLNGPDSIVRIIPWHNVATGKINPWESPGALITNVAQRFTIRLSSEVGHSEVSTCIVLISGPGGIAMAATQLSQALQFVSNRPPCHLCRLPGMVSV